jgi:hypothetical protein
MRENRPYGSEGGEGHQPFPTPINQADRIGSFCRAILAVNYGD